MTAPTRPVLRYHGGKWRLAPWIVSQFPAHRVYVDAFGGGGSVLAQKERSSIEVYNDADGAVVEVFRVLRDPVDSARLTAMLALTPYARESLRETFDEPPTDDRVERVRRLIVRAFMGHGTKGAISRELTGFHTALSDNGRYTRVTSWLMLPDAIAEWVERFRTVLVECADASEVIQRFDAPDALHYCDPPYLGHDRHYREKFGPAEHHRLAEVLHAAQGTVVLSGYPHPLLESLYESWERRETGTTTFMAAKRTEVVWIKSPGSRSFAHGQHGQQSLALGGVA